MCAAVSAFDEYLYFTPESIECQSLVQQHHAFSTVDKTEPMKDICIPLKNNSSSFTSPRYLSASMKLSLLNSNAMLADKARRGTLICA